MTDYYALIPAAGHGSRMGDPTPKQYLELLGRPLIHYAIARLCGCPQIKRVYVVLAADDEYWQQYDWSAFAPKLMPLFCGGAERFESVRNGLTAINAEVDANDWVLVHDAARPGLGDAALTRLIEEGGVDDVGGLLAVPLADTLKRADAANRVAATEPRAGLWQAQTPQMFRHAQLLEALTRSAGQMPTDEAQAIESMGLKPRLVLGDSRNFKVTWPQDMELAALMLGDGER
ncbi:MAG: 2-C-methyl-D-erythritol 4-phosphate cytidylyltransferase [Sulfuricellaceae bacterium]|nr:2-C-methyl-D-erythritol 4-phosphate cytidylyltransferase [Sulfuricellaceae bacterium]